MCKFVFIKEIDAVPYAVLSMVNSTGRWDDFTILR